MADQNYIALKGILDKKYVYRHDIETLSASGFDVKYVVPPDISDEQWIGYNILHLCAEKYCDGEFIKDLCSRGADFFQKNNKGFTPLRSVYEVCKESTNKLPSYERASMNAVLAIHLEYSNVTNPHCNQGISHFHIACLAGNWSVVQLFLKNHVPIDLAIKADSSIFPGCTGLHLAMFSEDKKTVQVLVNRGADCRRLNAEGKSPLHLIVEKQLEDASDSSIKSRNRKMKKNDPILKKVSKPTSDDPNPVDCIGLSYLHVCCTRKNKFKLVDLQKLLDAGVDLNSTVHFDSPLWPGYTGLHFAACCNLNTVILLLQNGANPFAKDVNGITPLDLCLKRYSLIKMIRIFNAHNTLQSLQLQNKSKLLDLFTAFRSTEELMGYLRNLDLDTGVISMDSPFCPGWSIFHFAIEWDGRKDISKTKVCLRKGVHFTIQDANGMSALHKAFYMKKNRCVEIILRAYTFTSINPVDKNGLSHFLIACIADKKEVVKMFLSEKVDPNITVQSDIKFEREEVIKAGSTPLHIAAIKSSPALAKLLLANGADPRRLDADGCTWIHRLNRYYYDEFNELLSLPEVLLSNPVGLPHLHFACETNDLPQVKALLPFTVDINKPIGKESMKGLKDCKKVTYLDTPLHLAVKNGYDTSLNIIDLLLKNKADITAKDENGLNPLQLALVNHESSHKKVITRLTLEYSKKKLFPDDIGLTKLLVACFLRDLSMIRKSLASLEPGESANSRLKMDSPLWPGEAPLNILMKKGYPKEDDAVKLLLRRILQELEKAVLQDQPFHESAKRKKKSLLENVNLVVNNEGLTAVHISCMGNDVDIVESFLRLGVDFNVPKDSSASEDAGYYPLHFAVKYGSNKVTELLMKYKVNFDCQDSKGNTPLQLAASRYQEKLDLFESLLYRSDDINKEFYLRLLDNDTRTKLRLVARLERSHFGENFKAHIESIPNINDVDAEGRNIFHYLNYHINCAFDIFFENIESLMNLGCKWDHQDKKGRTAFHYETLAPDNPRRGSEAGIENLILAGADVNIVDNFGNTPIEYCINWKKGYFRLHLTRLEAAGLHINDINKKYTRSKKDEKYCKMIQDLNRMKQYSITKSLTLRDVLTEKMVQFPMMPEAQQQAILDYLDSHNVKNNFDDWLFLFNLQRKKALRAKNLYKTVVMSLRGLLDSRLPDHCLDSILVCLSYEDWKNITLIEDNNY